MQPRNRPPRADDELTARAKSAHAQSAVADAVKSIDLLDPTSEVSRFEEKVRREEARVRGQQEIAASSLDAQFESLEYLGEKTEVEARLAALKSGGAGQSALTAGGSEDSDLALDYGVETTAEQGAEQTRVERG